MDRAGDMNTCGAALLILPAVLLGCSQRSSEAISESLARLRASTNSDAFVIVEDPTTKRYVQFSVFPDRQVHFDFPVQAAFTTPDVRGLWYHLSVNGIPSEGVVTQKVFMDQEEVGRLKGFLTDQGLTHAERCQAGTYFNGPVEGYMKSVNGVLPAQHDAKKFVDDVFTHVYELAPAENYTITEN